MKDRRLIAVMVGIVIAIWLVGAAITKYSIEQMAYYMPIAVIVIGLTAGLVVVWVKVIVEAVRGRRRQPDA
jgi:uncharacterized membrane protein